VRVLATERRRDFDVFAIVPEVCERHGGYLSANDSAGMWDWGLLHGGVSACSAVHAQCGVGIAGMSGGRAVLRWYNVLAAVIYEGATAESEIDVNRVKI
jgi:hypothetical protein